MIEEELIQNLVDAYKNKIREKVHNLVRSFADKVIEGNLHVQTNLVDFSEMYTKIQTLTNTDEFKALKVEIGKLQGYIETIENDFAEIRAKVKEFLQEKVNELQLYTEMEKPYIEMETEVIGRKVILKIVNYLVPATDFDFIEGYYGIKKRRKDIKNLDVYDQFKDMRTFIDHWGVYWDFKEDESKPQWESGLSLHQKIIYEVSHTYERDGEYKILVKVWDIFGYNSSRTFKVKIKSD